MIQTIKFRLHPTASQEAKLHEIFTIYNKVKRIGYKLLFQLKDRDYKILEFYRNYQFFINN
jgi:predicted transposase